MKFVTTMVPVPATLPRIVPPKSMVKESPRKLLEPDVGDLINTVFGAVLLVMWYVFPGAGAARLLHFPAELKLEAFAASLPVIV